MCMHFVAQKFFYGKLLYVVNGNFFLLCFIVLHLENFVHSANKLHFIFLYEY